MVLSVSKKWRMAFIKIRCHLFFPKNEQSWFFGSYKSPTGISWKYPAWQELYTQKIGLWNSIMVWWFDSGRVLTRSSSSWILKCDYYTSVNNLATDFCHLVLRRKNSTNKPFIWTISVISRRERERETIMVRKASSFFRTGELARWLNKVSR